MNQTGTFTTGGATTLAFALQGEQAGTVSLRGTYASVTLSFSCSDDGGANYYPCRLQDVATGSWLSSVSLPGGSPAPPVSYFFSLPTATHLLLTLTAAPASGTLNVNLVNLLLRGLVSPTPDAAAGTAAVVAVELTRPADTTAYAANDVVSNSTGTTTLMAFAAFARVNGGSGYIVGARLATNLKSITPRFRVHLYNAANPTVSADNAPHRSLYADLGKGLGYFDLPALSTAADTANSDSSRTLDFTLRVPFLCAAGSQTLYALLETLDAFTPASGQKFTLTLLGDLN